MGPITPMRDGPMAMADAGEAVADRASRHVGGRGKVTRAFTVRYWSQAPGTFPSDSAIHESPPIPPPADLHQGHQPPLLRCVWGVGREGVLTSYIVRCVAR
uniref:Uncharacterized protein n=1 Tax=Haptolina ericina TaxID=156174 RepID=A0A7S3BGH3_9EUKA